MLQWFYTQNKGNEDYTKTSEHEASFHTHYFTQNLEYAARLGVADAQAFLPVIRTFWVDLIAGLRFVSNSDTFPMTDVSGNPFTTWGAPSGGLGGYLAAYYTPSVTTDWCDDTATLGAPRACGPDFVYATHHSYVHLALASAALSESVTTTAQGATGAEVWSWMKAHAPFQQNYGAVGNTSTRVDPRYAWVPQFIRNVSVTPTTTTAALSFTSFSADTCRVGISSTGFASTVASSDASASMSGNNGSYTAIGLTPATTYSYRITAGPAGGTLRATGTFTTTGTGLGGSVVSGKTAGSGQIVLH
jgi:hypothetical protein